MKPQAILAIALVICLLPVLVLAQETILHQGNKTIIIKGVDDKSKLDELKNINIDVKMNDSSQESADAPFFGIFPADLDFPKAQELNYQYTYGVLITGIVPDSPAYQYRLAEDDIIMEMDGKKALNLKEFDKLKALYRAGDTVNLKIFRDDEVKNIEFVFGSKAQTQQGAVPGGEPGKAKFSSGGGGASWIPMYFANDMEDVNELLTAIGFSKLPEDGVLTQGFGIDGSIGKNWILGGQFQFYGDTKKIDETIGTESFTNHMKYRMFIGGATLDKRIPLSNSIITSLGVMVGGASHKIHLIHTNGDYNWPDAGESTQDITGSNSNVSFGKGYIMVQPRAELLVRVVSPLFLKAQVGYLYGYSPTQGWKVSHTSGEAYELSGSPNTPFQGLTVSIGPSLEF
jgi:hypothetical protein